MHEKSTNGIKYIFVTGGVVSGIGKGILAASIGYVLKSSGFDVDALKMDPYLNVDPGTMSPYEHGEVFVLKDGKETDLDLGNYERFMDIDLDKNSSISSGFIYTEIIKNEREGKYLGKTVQMIPHVTNYIKEKYGYAKKNIKFKIIEIGGSTGDIEAEVFLESLRQFKVEHSEVLHIHLGYIPFLKVVGEYKSKPLQNSIKELLRLGLQPDVLVLRYEENEKVKITKNFMEKVALYTNVDIDSIIKFPDLDSIYQSPKYLIENTPIIPRLEKFANQSINPILNDFFKGSNNSYNRTIKIALIAKYSGLSDSYLSVIESIKIASAYNKVNCVIQILDSEDSNLLECLCNYDGYIVPGGFGKRGLEEKINAIKWIRENKKPFLGICLGLQMSVLEFLRNKCKVSNAISSEMLEEGIENAGNIAIDLMKSQINELKKGATMRLGDYECIVKKDTLAFKLYNKELIVERHRHRLEVQNQYIKTLEQSGMIISGIHQLENEFLVEIVELDKSIHPYFIAIQSHPEFLSRPDKPHPLFDGLIKAII
jgi:CTP synthase